jgi:hypothetical protein
MFAEEGNNVWFEDVEMGILNCSLRYTDIGSVRKICNNTFSEDFIYMGPRNIINGEAIPEKDSEWYIPRSREYPLRQIQNKAMVKEILEDIERNPDKKSKYLDLRGKTLACVCCPSPCHCEVYVKVVQALLRRSAPLEH